MSWYRCSGCGPSIKCDVCGATQCAQNLGHNDACPEKCRRAKLLEGTPFPWNMGSPHGVRPTKHNRKWIGRDRAFRKKMHRNNPSRNAMKPWVRSRGTWIKNPYYYMDLFMETP